MKIINLTYNELIKELKKPSIKIFLLILILSSVLIPLGFNYFGSKSKIQTEVAMWNHNNGLNLQNEYLDSYEDDGKPESKIAYEYSLLLKEEYELAIEHEIAYDTWERKTLDYYIESMSYKIAFDFISEGYDIDIVKENASNVNNLVIDKYINSSKNEILEARDFYNNESEKLKAILQNGDYIGFSKENLKRETEGLKLLEESKKEYEKYKEENLKKLEEEELISIDLAIKKYDMDIEKAKEDIKIIQFRVDNNIDYDEFNWKNISLNRLYEINMRYNFEIEPEEIYNGANLSYDEYEISFNNDKKIMLEEKEEIWYTLENDIQKLGLVIDARESVDKSYEVYIIFSVFISIIVASGTVASEFSKGTIRLLLIRPIARWKILLSKLLSIFILGLITAVLGVSLLFITSGMVFGFESYSIPVVDTINSTIIEGNFITYIISKALTSYISTIFITSTAFMISTISKNTAISVAISMLVYLGSALATTLIFGFMYEVSIMNTFIPFINSSFLRIIPGVEEAMLSIYGQQVQYESGIIVLIIMAVIILITTFIKFIKNDIKN